MLKPASACIDIDIVTTSQLPHQETCVSSQLPMKLWLNSVKIHSKNSQHEDTQHDRNTRNTINRKK